MSPQAAFVHLISRHFLSNKLAIAYARMMQGKARLGMVLVTGQKNERYAPGPGLCSTETIQVTPNRSCSMPNFAVQNVFSSGMVTKPS